MKTVFCFSDTCAETAARITTQLEAADVRISPSFVLRSAIPETFPCACQAYNSAACQCDMVVLLAYAKNSAHPLTLLLHGNRQETWATVEYPNSAALLPHLNVIERLLHKLASGSAQQKEEMT